MVRRRIILPWPASLTFPLSFLALLVTVGDDDVWSCGNVILLASQGRLDTLGEMSITFDAGPYHRHIACKDNRNIAAVVDANGLQLRNQLVQGHFTTSSVSASS